MRVHSFEQGFEGLPPAGSAAVQPEMLPDGTHDVTINEAIEGPHKYPDNYPGDFLHLTLIPNSEHGRVWVSLGLGEKDAAIAGSLAQALGLSADDWADTDPADLIGRKVRAITRQVTGKNGKTRVYCNGFLLEEKAQQPVAKKPAARTPAQKVAAAAGNEAGGGDDIPF